MYWTIEVKIKGPVIIGKKCKISGNAIIGPNTSIGNECIISGGIISRFNNNE